MSFPGDSVALKHKPQFERLPRTVIPTFYDIKLKPDLIDLTFTGYESVSIKIKESIEQIVLNVDDLIINKAIYVAEGSGDEVQGSAIINPDNQTASIKFISSLQPGSGKLYLVFKGNLNDQMIGFYRCKYKSADGEERYSAATQFETTYARRAFPCWDEPAIKAKFQITIIAPKDLVVLSNTKVISEELYNEDPNLKVVKFAETPIMSTYLVAFVIGEYEYLETKTETGTLVRVYTPIGAKNRGQHALETAAKCLTFFKNYFNIPYPLEKIDHIAVPVFVHGAMENWGLVIYRESCLLEDLYQEDSFLRDGIAYIICHETVHQWIGNLVTMDWWTHLWINEGLANFFQYLAVSKIHPELQVWSEFVHSECCYAFELDSCHKAQPFEVPIENPQEVEQINGSNYHRYHKGASIIRMCYKWVGDKIFRKGLHDYLVKHAYKTATTEDLWKALEKASKKRIVKMMATWTKQTGFPMVYVSSRIEGNRRILTLKQERFLTDKLLDVVEEHILWHIPITIVTSHNPTQSIVKILMKSKTMEISLNNRIPNEWIKINPLVTGFYYVIYSSDMLKLLKPAIQNKQIGTIDRHQLLNDLSNVFRASKVHFADLLQLLSFYDQEDDVFIWEEINATVNSCIISVGGAQSRLLLRSVGQKLYASVCVKLGLNSSPDEKPALQHLRIAILEKLIQFGDEKVIEEAKKIYADQRNGNESDQAMKDAMLRAIERCLDENSN